MHLPKSIMHRNLRVSGESVHGQSAFPGLGPYLLDHMKWIGNRRDASCLEFRQLAEQTSQQLSQRPGSPGEGRQGAMAPTHHTARPWRAVTACRASASLAASPT